MGRRGRNNLTNEYLFFITTTIKNFTPVFKYQKCCDILIDNVKHYQKKYNFRILAYVIMPTHFHWIVFLEPGKGTISDIMRDIKKYSAWDILHFLEEKNKYVELVALGKPVKLGQRKQLWMHRFDDEVIRNEKMFCTKLKYIHKNPIEAGLVKKAEDYKYSSAKNYVEKKNRLLKIDMGYIGTEMIDFIK